MRSGVVGVVLLLAVLSGCSTEDAKPAEVEPLASGGASASASGSVEATKAEPKPSATIGSPSPAQPRVEHAATVDGASAFAREFVLVIGEGFADADSRAVRQRSAPGCEGCDALIGAIDEAAKAGLRLRGGDYRVSSIATPPFEGGDVVLLLTYSRGASEIVDAAGDVVDRGAAVPQTTVQMRLIYGEGGWRTQGYRIV